jgi:hypothetical protein
VFSKNNPITAIAEEESMLAALLLSAAALTPSVFTLKAQSVRADWYVLALDQKLKVEVEECERFLAEVEKHLGVQVGQFSYYRVQRPEDIAQLSPTKQYAGGLAYAEGIVFSTEECSRHELVHLASFQLGRVDPFFNEGLATMLAKDYGFLDRRKARRHAQKRGDRYDSVNRLIVNEMSTAGASDIRSWYVLSDAWIRHLVKHYGLAKLKQFFQTQLHSPDTRKVFKEVYSRELDEVFDTWLYGKKGYPYDKRPVIE